MNIMDELRLTDELRRFANEWDWLDYKADDSARKLRAIADHIDAEHERVTMNVINDALYYANEDDMAELGWIRLPKDANGEYIHVGDVLEGFGQCHEVDVLELHKSGKWTAGEYGSGDHLQMLDGWHVVKPPTVEDVLEEMYDALEDARIPNGSEKRTYEEIIAEYAAKLQLKEDA